MIIVKEILGLVKTRQIDRVHGLKLIEDYAEFRDRAHSTTWRSDKGSLLKLKAQKFEDELKASGIVTMLRTIDSKSYYPKHIDGETFDMTEDNRIAILTKLIEKIGD